MKTDYKNIQARYAELLARWFCSSKKCKNYGRHCYYDLDGDHYHLDAYCLSHWNDMIDIDPTCTTETPSAPILKRIIRGEGKPVKAKPEEALPATPAPPAQPALGYNNGLPAGIVYQGASPLYLRTCIRRLRTVY